MMDKIKQFAKEQGYDDAVYLNKWRGYDCYEPVFDGEGVSYVGLPYIILVKGPVIRLSTIDESFEQMSETK